MIEAIIKVEDDEIYINGYIVLVNINCVVHSSDDSFEFRYGTLQEAITYCMENYYDSTTD